jgi:hypothetical protein
VSHSSFPELLEVQRLFFLIEAVNLGFEVFFFLVLNVSLEVVLALIKRFDGPDRFSRIGQQVVEIGRLGRRIVGDEPLTPSQLSQGTSCSLLLIPYVLAKKIYTTNLIVEKGYLGQSNPVCI